MTNYFSTFSMLGYGLSCVAYLLLFLFVEFKLRRHLSHSLVGWAALATSIWAFFLAQNPVLVALSPADQLMVDGLYHLVWIVSLSAILRGAVAGDRGPGVGSAGVMVSVVVVVAGILFGLTSRLHGNPKILNLLGTGTMLLAIFAIVLIEQIFRNSRQSQHASLKYLCVGLGSMFAYDIIMFSNLVLTGGLDQMFWAVRGYLVALMAPLLAISISRLPSWSPGIFVSRQIVFYSATIFAAGIYLSAVALFVYYIRAVGGEWGKAAQFAIAVSGIVFVFVFLFSDQLRRRLRVTIDKHFFENRYDYRRELLRLMDTLTAADEDLPLYKRAVKSVAQIVESECGLLWLRNKGRGEFECVAGWNMNKQPSVLSEDASLAKFLDRTKWIIEFDEYELDPNRYDGLHITEEFLSATSPDLLVPVTCDRTVDGFVLLYGDNDKRALNYEDRDLLKTAGHMVGIQLAQDAATEELYEIRQFEAFNRFSAFFMHDMKNLIAQLSLVVQNARTHKGNPEFVDDMVATIASSVARMRNVLDNLHNGSPSQVIERIELGKVVMQAVSSSADRVPVPHAKIGDQEVWVRASRERLLMAISHAIRNAQDASDSDGTIEVHVDPADGQARISIIDNGCGMSDTFVEERLFKPFDSTKGAQGMGIGAYQMRETVQSVGGTIEIDTEKGVGTTVTLILDEIQASRVSVASST